MFKFSRRYELTEEFEARQLAFDFAIVARAVLHIAIEGKKKASAMLARFVRSCRSGWTVEKPVRIPQQLVLPADDFHQLDLQLR